MDPEATWPLQVPPRTLGALLQVVLFEQQVERSAGGVRHSSDVIVVQIWEKFLDALLKLADNPDSTEGKFGVDTPNWNVLRVHLFICCGASCRRERTARPNACIPFPLSANDAEENVHRESLPPPPSTRDVTPRT